jgi:hypothetical protein
VYDLDFDALRRAAERREKRKYLENMAKARREHDMKEYTYQVGDAARRRCG